MNDGISPRQFHEADGVEDWRVVGDGACTYFRTGSFAAGARLMQPLPALAATEGPYIDSASRHRRPKL